MMQLPDNEKYSASDIERYYSGKMSSEERNALEKAALSDPFLADAMEGYAYTKTPGKDSIKLRSRLDARVRKKDNKPLVFLIPAWTKIAALIVIIAGCGLIIYKIVLPRNRSVASSEKHFNNSGSQINAVTPKDSTINVGSVRPNSEINLSETPPESKSFVNKKLSPDKKSNVASNVNSLERDSENEKPKTKELAVTKPGKLLDRQLSGNNSGYQQPSGNASAPTTKNRSYLNNKRDSDSYTFYKTETAPVSQAKSINNDTVKNVDVVLKPIPDQLNEVVVSKRGQKNKNVRNTEIIQDTLEPASGWTNFNDYVANNIKSPEELHMKPISGDVQLSFDIDKSGEPVNIKIDKSLCEKCDEEAIRLLKEGPKWKNKKSKKRKISIKF